MSISELIQKASEETPEGWELIIQVEKGKVRVGTVNPSRVWMNATNNTDPYRELTQDISEALKDTQLDRS